MVLNAESKPWWETHLEWTLPDNLQRTLEITQKILKKNLPATLSEHHLGRLSIIDRLEPDPVDSIKLPNKKQCDKATRSVGNTVPPPPPKPFCLLPKSHQAKSKDTGAVMSESIRAVNMPTELQAKMILEEKMREACQKIIANTVSAAIEEKHLTLTQLLDPDFCEYT